MAIDLAVAKVPYTPLSPLRLRERLRDDAAAHCARLRGRADLLRPLLKYALADLDTGTCMGGLIRPKYT